MSTFLFTGSFVDDEGIPQHGRVKVTPSILPLYDPENEMVAWEPFIGKIDKGILTMRLPADDSTPIFFFVVEARMNSGRQYYFAMAPAEPDALVDFDEAYAAAIGPALGIPYAPIEALAGVESRVVELEGILPLPGPPGEPGPPGQPGEPGPPGTTTWGGITDKPTVFKPDVTDPSLLATFATGGEVRSKAKADGTDQTSVVQAELDALYDAGGGTLVLPSSPLGAVPIKVSKLTLKNDGATPAKMPTIGLRGQAMHWSGRGTAPQGGTIIEFTGTDTYGLIKSNALGALVIDGITLRNTTAANSTPFIYTTNTTLLLSRVAFYGAKAGAACDQDAIVLGGPNQIEGASGWTDGFQGYGTVIRECFFSGIRTAVKGQAFANAVVVRDNTVWTTCGNPSGAPIEWNGKPTTGTQKAAGCVIEGNLLELPNYKYGIRLLNASTFTLSANNMYDSTGTTTAGILLDATTQGMILREGFTPPGLPPVVDNGADNWFYPSSQGIYAKMPPAKFLDANYPTEILKLKVTGPDSFGLIVQPAVAQVDGATMMKLVRSAAEATNAGAAIRSWKQDGSVTVDSTAAGGGNFTGPFSRWTAGGRTWSGVGSQAGQTNGSTMTIDSGPGGSYLDLKNYGVRFYDHNGGPLRATIGAGANQIRFGAAAAINDRPGIISGAGTPEGAVTAPVGSMFLRTDGGAGTTMYVKETGTGNTGWVAK